MLKKRLRFLHYLHEQIYSALLLCDDAESLNFNIYQGDEDNAPQAELPNSDIKDIALVNTSITQRIHIHVAELQRLRRQMSENVLLGANGQILLLNL